MNLYLVFREDYVSYDEYDSFVVVCDTEDEARFTHPSGLDKWNYEKHEWEWRGSSWVNPMDVRVVLLGTADPSITRGVSCASYNAG